MLRRWPALLVAFCMAWCQQGALLHVLRHHMPLPVAQAGHSAPSHQDGVGCDTCFAFAHAASAMAAACPVAGLLSTADRWIVHERFARLPARAPEASARDPPSS